MAHWALHTAAWDRGCARDYGKRRERGAHAGTSARRWDRATVGTTGRAVGATDGGGCELYPSAGGAVGRKCQQTGRGQLQLTRRGGDSGTLIEQQGSGRVRSPHRPLGEGISSGLAAASENRSDWPGPSGTPTHVGRRDRGGLNQKPVDG